MVKGEFYTHIHYCNAHIDIEIYTYKAQEMERDLRIKLDTKVMY